MSELSDVLSSNYMLASLTVRTWSARKTDKDATADLLAQKGAASDAASVVKSLLAGNDKELKDTQAAYARIRTWFYANSLPWTTDDGRQRGDRLIGTAQAMTFLRDFANLKTSAEKARDKFMLVYDSAVSNAAVSLGSMYDPSQYPAKELIRSLFGATLDVSPMPAVTDFDRVSIPGAMATGLKNQYEKKAAKQVSSAITSAQERLIEELQRMQTQLDKIACGEKARLYGSLITNMETVAGLATSLGPLSPELVEIAAEVRTDILKYKIEDFKDNGSLCAAISDKADSILNKLRMPEPTPEIVQEKVEQESVQAEHFADFDEDDVFNID